MPTLTALALTCSLAVASNDEFKSESHGFRVERPGDAWEFRQETLAASELKLSIYPKERTDGAVILSIRAKVVGDGETPEDVLAEALEAVERGPQYADVEEQTERIAGKKAPGLILRYKTPSSGDFRFRQNYLVEDGVRYVLEFHAPIGEYDGYARDLKKIFKSFDLVAPSREAKRERTRLGLIGRCGSEVEWEPSWNDAAAKARAERKLVLVLVRSLSGFNITDYARSGVFMNPDVIELVNERFILFRLEKGMDAPFKAQSSYGMSGTTFGTSLLIATPDGEIVGDSCAIAPAPAYDFLLESLERIEGFPGTPAPDGLAGIERAKRLIARGELDEATALLFEDRSAEGRLLLASIHRRLRRTDEAFAALAEARDADTGELETAIALAETVLHFRLGDTSAACQTLAGIEDADSNPEALFWRGACSIRSGNADDGERTWDELIDHFPESRWAWKAAATMDSTGFKAMASLRTEWPAEDVLDSLRWTEPAPLPNDAAAQAEADAVAYLLLHQRDDGSWISASEFRGKSEKYPNIFTDAVTAICGMAMLQRRDRPECEAAAENAVEFLLATHKQAKLAGEQEFFMDYTIWSHSWVLWFFADCLEAGVGDKTAMRSVMKDRIANLREKQKANGGWSYYLTSDLESGSEANQSISFVSAGAALGLLRAKEAGVAVPKRVVKDVLDCLEAMFDEENGVFQYMRFVGANGKPAVNPPGAAGRGPAIELALLHGGRGDVDRVRRALDVFMEHRASYSKELGKSLMHAGPDGQGSHYLMFDYALSAKAVRELPLEERAEYRAKILELILEGRGEHGGFQDTPLNGWAYGTAMALLALRDLELRP